MFEPTDILISLDLEFVDFIKRAIRHGQSQMGKTSRTVHS